MTDRPPRIGSGEHRIEVEVRALQTEVEELDKPPSIRRPPSWRDVCRMKACAAFVRGVDTLIAHGWSKRRIAKTIGCDIHTLCDWLEGTRQVPAWAVHALPREGRVGYVRAIIDTLPAEDEDEFAGKQLSSVA